MIVAAVQLIAGLLAMWGIDIDPESQSALVENIDVLIGAVLALSGIVMGVMRLITDGPVGGAK